MIEDATSRFINLEILPQLFAQLTYCYCYFLNPISSWHNREIWSHLDRVEYLSRDHDSRITSDCNKVILILGGNRICEDV